MGFGGCVANPSTWGVEAEGSGVKEVFIRDSSCVAGRPQEELALRNRRAASLHSFLTLLSKSYRTCSSTSSSVLWACGLPLTLRDSSLLIIQYSGLGLHMCLVIFLCLETVAHAREAGNCCYGAASQPLSLSTVFVTASSFSSSADNEAQSPIPNTVIFGVLSLLLL